MSCYFTLSFVYAGICASEYLNFDCFAYFCAIFPEILKHDKILVRFSSKKLTIKTSIERNILIEPALHIVSIDEAIT